MDYKEEYESRIHDAVKERRETEASMKQSKNEFAEYLKKNFDSQYVQYMEAQKEAQEEVQEEIKKESEKSKVRKFFDKLINVL